MSGAWHAPKHYEMYKQERQDSCLARVVVGFVLRVAAVPDVTCDRDFLIVSRL
jgi:hypothetical protein